MLKKTAAILAGLTALIHTIVGGSDALAPMLVAGLPNEAEGAMHACFHIVTVLLFWSVIVFWRGGKAAWHFGLLWAAASLVFIYVGLSQAGLNGLIINPQWTILGVTSILALLSVKYKLPKS